MSDEFDEIFNAPGAAPTTPATPQGDHGLKFTSRPHRSVEEAADALVGIAHVDGYLFGYVDPATLRVISYFKDPNPGATRMDGMKNIQYLLPLRD